MVKNSDDIVSKWGEQVARKGFAQVPNYLLQVNRFLDDEHRLSPLELLILIELVGSWWKKGDLPFPSMRSIGLRCGASERQVQRSINRLVGIGVLKKTKRERKRGLIASNAYDLDPLVSLLNEIADNFVNDHPRKLKKETDLDTLSYFSKGNDEALKVMVDAINCLIKSGYSKEEAEKTVKQNFSRVNNNPNLVLTIEELCKQI